MPSKAMETAVHAAGKQLGTLRKVAEQKGFPVWGHGVCNRCLKSFDYIKQHRAPIPVMCNRCDP